MPRYTFPTYPKRPRMDSADGLEAWQAWWKKAHEVADAEAARISVDLPAEVAAMRRGSDAAIILRQMTEPTTYQCESGHFYEVADGNVPALCGRCGKQTVCSCSCGALLALTYQYKPPYKKVNPVSQISREACLACRRLYPWSSSYLHRATNDALDAYDQQLVPFADGYPSTLAFNNELNMLRKLIPPEAVSFFQKLFGSRVEVSDPRHSQHSQWVSACVANEERVSAFRAQILSVRRGALSRQAKEAQKRAFWRSLSGTEFEHHLAKLLKDAGFAVRHVGGRNDQGADLMIVINNARVVVQCKAFAKPVGPGPVRDLLGALHHHEAKEAWLVSLLGFTGAAILFASGKPIRLLPIESFLGAAGSKQMSLLKRSL